MRRESKETTSSGMSTSRTEYPAIVGGLKHSAEKGAVLCTYRDINNTHTHIASSFHMRHLTARPRRVSSRFTLRRQSSARNRSPFLRDKTIHFYEIELDISKVERMDLEFDERKEMECDDKDGEISRSVVIPVVKEPPPVGILRLDVVKPRRSSAEFRCLGHVNEENSDEEDYSASVSAIMQRRASIRKSKRRASRRASSPFTPDILPGTENERRRSSCYTTSSGETAISVEDNLVSEVTQAQIYENIRLHKEVLSSVKMQPWHMRKKIRLVVQAKNYIKRHEGVLQERLAQSHSTRDMLARWHIYIVKRWQRIKRETANLSNWLIPWELRIKEIESHFGSVVASYFTFLRWLFWVNLVTSVIMIAFVTIPELLIRNVQPERKQVLAQDRYNATNFYTLMDFEGILKYSPLFYGWYTDRDAHGKGYRLPLAYFMTGLAVYVYNFVATLRKMAENSRMSKLSEKEDECVFSWKVFTSWDYMIGNSETAANRVASIVMGFKEALLEEAEKKKDTKNWKIIFIRMLVNVAICGLLVLSAYAVVLVVKRSTEPEAKKNFWRMNEITIVMNLISLVFPMIFEILGLGEQYHPRKQLRLQLARIMLLNLLNLYSLNFALFDKISDMQKEWDDSLSVFYNSTNCTRICSNVTISKLGSANLTPLDRKIRSIEGNFNGNGLGMNFSYNATEEDLQGVLFWNTTQFQENATSSDTTFAYLGNGSRTPFTTMEALWNFTTEEGVLDFRENFDKFLRYLYSESTIGDFDVGNVTKFLLNGTDSTPNYSELFENLSSTSPTSTDSIAANFLISTTDLVTSSVTINEAASLSTSELRGTAPYTEASETKNIPITTLIPRIFPPISPQENLTCSCRLDSIEDFMATLDYKNQSKLRSLCWETMFGQELVKLTVMDLFMTIMSTLAMDFFRGVFVRVMNNCWCWDLEKIFPQYGDFKVAENILHLVNNQGMVWMGMFFSPGIIAINVVKLYVMVYFRSWIVLTCNVPHKVVFRASRSNNFYYALLLSMLFLCVIPVGYAIVWVRPSKHCGPFSDYDKIFQIFTKTLREIMPSSVHQILDYIASPGVVIPLLVLMILIIYYLVSLTDALREANNDLKIQLRRERTEERRKLFQIADRRRRVGSEGSGELGQTPFGKWKKLLYNLPSGKSFEDTPKQESEEAQYQQQEEKEVKQEGVRTKDFFSKLIKRALKKSPTSEDEEASDTDQPDSLPEDVTTVKEVKPQAPFKKPFAIKKDLNFKAAAVHKGLAKRDSQDTNLSVDFEPNLTPIASRHSSKNRRDSFDLKKHQSKKKPADSRSATKSSSNSKDFREDSLTSTWSDNIPVITISKSDSVEHVEKRVAEKKLHDIEEQLSAVNGDILAQERVDTRSKSRYVLKKQEVTEDEEAISELAAAKFVRREAKEAQGDDGVTAKEDPIANFDTKTESSNDYKDSAFS
ncbi:hypothetical protein Trydic_g2751 [Trypoxylus dichotomus]